MLKRYKNASILLRFNENSFIDGDIVTDGNHISYIGPSQNGKEEIVDLKGFLIVPSFKNGGINLLDLGKKEIEERIFDSVKSGVTDIVAISSEYEFCKEIFEKLGIDYKIALPFENIKRYKSDPHMLVYVDPLKEEENVLDEISDYAAKNSLKLVIKLFDNLEETGKLNSTKKMLPINYVESFGLLDRGGTILGSIWSDKEDYALLNSYDFDVTIRPVNDLKNGNGFSNVTQIKNGGLDIKVGSGEEKNTDFFREARAILLGTRGMLTDKDAITEGEVLETIACGQGLKEGGKANFVVLDKKFANVEDILNYADKRDVFMTIANGKTIYRRGEKNDNQ